MSEEMGRLSRQLYDDWVRIRNAALIELCNTSRCLPSDIVEERVTQDHLKYHAPGGLGYEVKIVWPSMSPVWGEAPDLTVRVVADPIIELHPEKQISRPNGESDDKLD